MNRRFLPSVIALAAPIVVTQALLAQPLRTSTEPGVWSKNMELIKPLNWSVGEPVNVVSITANSTTKTYVIGTVGTKQQTPDHYSNDAASTWASHVEVLDVNDPRTSSTGVAIRGLIVR